MKAILVSVDYGDILALTLPKNSQYFDEMLVITAPHDHESQIVACSVANARCFVTDAFYRDGAAFNKGAGMELGFDIFGRNSEFCILDADILLPPEFAACSFERGKLYSPRRRMLLDLNDIAIAHEPARWGELPLKRDGEFAGYCQVFFGTDPVLQSRPWYTSWQHAGGCDSDFQSRWDRRHKVRPEFEVLHIGPDGTNWCGRHTQRLDGSLPRDSAARKQAIEALHARRRLPGYRAHDNERVTP